MSFKRTKGMSRTPQKAFVQKMLAYSDDPSGSYGELKKAAPRESAKFRAIVEATRKRLGLT